MYIVKAPLIGPFSYHDLPMDRPHSCKLWAVVTNEWYKYYGISLLFSSNSTLLPRPQQIRHWWMNCASAHICWWWFHQRLNTAKANKTFFKQCVYIQSILIWIVNVLNRQIAIAIRVLLLITRQMWTFVLTLSARSIYLLQGSLQIVWISKHVWENTVITDMIYD